MPGPRKTDPAEAMLLRSMIRPDTLTLLRQAANDGSVTNLSRPLFSAIRDPSARSLLVAEFLDLAGDFKEEVEKHTERIDQQPELVLAQIYRIDKILKTMRKRAIALMESKLNEMQSNSSVDLARAALKEKGLTPKRLGINDDLFRSLCQIRNNDPKSLETLLTDKERFGYRYLGEDFVKLARISQAIILDVPGQDIDTRAKSIGAAIRSLKSSAPEDVKRTNDVFAPLVFGEQAWRDFCEDVAKAVTICKQMEEFEKEKGQKELVAVIDLAEHAVVDFARKNGMHVDLA